MSTIDKNLPPTKSDFEAFLKEVIFPLPEGFINFYKDSNGADISSDENYTILWPITDLMKLNKDYNVERFAPEFFIFGSDGGDTAFAIEKATGRIFEMPFIGMSRQEAVLITDSFSQFLNTR